MFIRSPHANSEDELQEFLYELSRFCPDLDQGRAAEILWEQIAEIEAGREMIGMRSLLREADELDGRAAETSDQILKTVATTPRGLIAQLRFTAEYLRADERVFDVLVAGVERVTARG